MSIDPQSFFKFSAQHFTLLRDLYYRDGGVNDADLQELYERNRKETDPSPTHMMEQLFKLRIIEPLPEATASYEITRPVRNLLSFLFQEQRLTSAAVIQAYLDDLAKGQQELDSAIKELRPSAVERSLSEISETVDRLRHDSRANKEAIVAEVMAVKSNRERKTVKDRFEKINLLMTRFIEPMRDLIDVRKAMDVTLDSLERLLRAGTRAYRLDGAITREIARTRARLLRLRRDAASDFHESLREIEPLYESLKRDSELVQAVSRILERIGKEGLDTLNLAERLSIPSRRGQEGLFTDLALEAFLHGVKGYVPQQPEPLPEPTAAQVFRFIDPVEMEVRLRAATPVPDLLAWILSCYEDVPAGEVLRAYGRVHKSDKWRCKFGDQERSYPFKKITFFAHPMQIEVAL